MMTPLPSGCESSSSCGVDEACLRVPPGGYACVCTLNCPPRTDGWSTTTHLPTSSTIPSVDNVLIEQSLSFSVILMCAGLLLIILILLALLIYRSITEPRVENVVFNPRVSYRKGESKEPMVAISPSEGGAAGDIIDRFIPLSQYSISSEYSDCQQQLVLDPLRWMNVIHQDVHSSTAPFQLIPSESVEVGRTIGHGCYGNVYLGTLKQKNDHKIVAVKKMNPENAKRSVALRDFLREAEIMTRFFHPNMTQLIGVLFEGSPRAPCLVLQFMQYGDLHSLLKATFSPNLDYYNAPIPYKLKPDHFIFIAEQIANGMVYFSSRRFVHRDLAARNILVSKSQQPRTDEDGNITFTPDDLEVKIADFGMCREMHENDYIIVGGTEPKPVRWMAPESLSCGKYSSQSDVWSFAITLWELFSGGQKPYGNYNDIDAMKMIRDEAKKPYPVPKFAPHGIVELIVACWEKDPIDRITFLQAHAMLDILVRDTTTIFTESPPSSPSHTIVTCQAEIHRDDE